MDDEVKGEGNSYTTHFRLLDPRLGRWLSIDPVTNPSSSPYTSMENSPIAFNDILGLYTKREAKKMAREVEKLGGKATITHTENKRHYIVTATTQWEGENFSKGYVQGGIKSLNELEYEPEINQNTFYDSDYYRDAYDASSEHTLGERKTEVAGWRAAEAEKQAG